MSKDVDALRTKILHIIERAQEPLETKEIEDMLVNFTRIKIMYRLNLLRGEGVIKGKQVGSGKGTWIWWKL